MLLARVGPFHAGVVHQSFGFQAGNPLDELVVKIGVANVCVPDSLQGYLPGAGLHVVGPVAGALLATQSVGALLLHVPLAAQIGDTLLLRQAVALQQLLLLRQAVALQQVLDLRIAI